MGRIEAARSTDINSLQAELDSFRNNTREQLKEKDTKINELIEEVGNTQALLSDKTNELDLVSHSLNLDLYIKNSSTFAQ